jgi:hypothetical protein
MAEAGIRHGWSTETDGIGAMNFEAWGARLVLIVNKSQLHQIVTCVGTFTAFSI